MLSTNLSLSSSLMHRVARNPAAGARGPAGAPQATCNATLEGQLWKPVATLLVRNHIVFSWVSMTPCADPNASWRGLKAATATWPRPPQARKQEVDALAAGSGSERGASPCHPQRPQRSTDSQVSLGQSIWPVNSRVNAPTRPECSLNLHVRRHATMEDT